MLNEILLNNYLKECLVYDELERVSASKNNEDVSTNAVTELRHENHKWKAKLKKEIGSPSDTPDESQQQCEWRNIEDYTFNTRDTKRWFNMLKRKRKDHAIGFEEFTKIG